LTSSAYTVFVCCYKFRCNRAAKSLHQNVAGFVFDTSNDNFLLDSSFTNSSGGDGIALMNSRGNSLIGNTSDMNAGNGFCIDPGNTNNRFIGNETSANANNGFWLNSSDGNTITGKTSSNNIMSGMTGMGSMAGAGEISLNMSSNNTIYHNNFTSSMSPQASVSGGSGNVFSQPLPAGGNYWSMWTSPDANNDGIVDSPYVFTGGEDDLPWTSANGWQASGKPSLILETPASFWASASDYQARQLSVRWTIDNSGSGSALAASITGCENGNGVQLLTPLPALAGDIGPGGAGSVTLRYQVPDGVAAWNAINAGHAYAADGVEYAYP
jgi:hypothetical protein